VLKKTVRELIAALAAGQAVRIWGASTS